LLTITVFILLRGQVGIAACLSAISVFVLQGSTRLSTTKNLERWLILSFLTTLASLASWIVLYLASGLENVESYKMWFLGSSIPKINAVALIYYLYRDFHFGPVEREDTMLFLEIKISILKGRDLVAKDTNIFGRHTTSDPYVKVHHGPNKLGKTAIIKKTLDPEWKNENFRVAVVPRALDVYRTIECNIFDHDNLSSDDPMGTVFVPIPSQRNFKAARWYPVEKGEGDNHCRNAKGELLVEVEVRSQLAKSFKRQLLSQASQRLLNVDKKY
jgi:hypothetical protein